ncbi:MAG: propionyl-CoA--succinate CoA transferase [Pseudopedobacter saltans]|uniref:Propionyl-CoA--succinate CoA transferase n=1 Tax=Pseudopedobacter saltans TaxID=151895 RepID=A0A2W5H2N6_9SPHI|nr:MAG: propionyl-CoA--succinate CoA transferase [Pseudopedobacter saltans]
MYEERIKRASLRDKVISAEESATFFKDGMVVGASGFTRGGDTKVVLKALAKRAQNEPLKIQLFTGASLGHGNDADLSNANALAKRLPFQVDTDLRNHINHGDLLFIDQHLGETNEALINGDLPKVDIAVIEATQILEDGSIVPTTSVGNNVVFLDLADKIIIEINTAIPLEIRGLHDIFRAGKAPNKQIIPIIAANTRIGTDTISIDPNKIVGIVFHEITDMTGDIVPPDEITGAIADNILDFLSHEVKKGRLTESLLPLQCGIGKVANAVMSGFLKSNFKNLTMYSEVLQDSTFELIDAGMMDFASSTSMTVSQNCYNKFMNNLDKYRDKVVFRPQNISNSVEVIRRLGVIGINTALEVDMYGNVNSTHVGGTKMMNGIGGSGDFARNAYMSIFVTSSTAKGNNISSVVPMVSHHDHTEHDVDVLVTEKGLADLRGLAPRERVPVVINNIVHEDYRDEFMDYFNRAKAKGGQTPHLLEEAFKWHNRFNETGSMKG